MAGLAAAEAAEQAVPSGLPVTARIDRVLLIAGTEAPKSWHVLHKFTLVPASDPR
jgi:hypothetical protein